MLPITIRGESIVLSFLFIDRFRSLKWILGGMSRLLYFTFTRYADNKWRATRPDGVIWNATHDGGDDSQDKTVIAVGNISRDE